jgi:hypothetical protein
MSRFSKSALLALTMCTALAVAPAIDCAWAKDGNSGSGGSGSGGGGSNSGGGGSGSGGGDSNSGKGGEGGSETGNSGNGGNSINVGSVSSLRSSDNNLQRRKNLSSLHGSPARKGKRKPATGVGTLTGSTNELQADLLRAQQALKDAEWKFNQGLANPKANLRKLEQAIRDAEIAITALGARLDTASGQ